MSPSLPHPAGDRIGKMTDEQLEVPMAGEQLEARRTDERLEVQRTIGILARTVARGWP